MSRGAYRTARAAALAGVPEWTLKEWARSNLLAPSVSTDRPRLWSHDDLLRIRLVAWLRRTKQLSDEQIAAASMETMGDTFDPIAPFRDGAIEGPHLVHPRETLLIHPGKLSGAPHVAGTRVETMAIFAIAESGFDTDGIIRLYPFLSEAQVEDAIDLERQLNRNVRGAEKPILDELTAEAEKHDLGY